MRRQTRFANLVLTLPLHRSARHGDPPMAHIRREIEARSNAAMSASWIPRPKRVSYWTVLHAVLIFPRVLKAGFGVGGEYGEGVLRKDGESLEYYRTAAASIGFQLGACRAHSFFCSAN